jgi:hypothetical protein
MTIPPHFAVFRTGVVPQLSLACLEKLAWTLHSGDFIREQTVFPTCVYATMHQKAEAACVLGSALWHGRNLVTVGQVEDDFHRLMDRADELCRAAGLDLGPCPTAKLIAFIDGGDREQMRAEFLSETNLAILAVGGVPVV